MAKSDFTRIPTIGPKLAARIEKLGYSKVCDLMGENPQEMYDRDCIMSGQHVDRCVLYAYRLAVYVANTDMPDTNKLAWWHFKD